MILNIPYQIPSLLYHRALASKEKEQYIMAYAINADVRTPQEFKRSEERLAGGSHARDRRESQFGMRISDGPRTRALAKCDWLSGTYASDRRESQFGIRNAQCGGEIKNVAYRILLQSTEILGNLS